MADSNKTFTLSTSIKTSSLPSSPLNDAELKDENGMNWEMASGLKKQLPTKRFMSPTISAYIKAAAVPSRKILAERNETLDLVEPMNLSRSFITDSKASKSPVFYNVKNKSGDEAYDPIKNYLSPRPKFLRYNLDRRNKLAFHREHENNLEKSSSSDAEILSREEQMEEEGVIEKRGEEEEEEEEEEEFEEDGGCSFRGFMKVMFLVFAFFLTTLAISSMNSPTPSDPAEAVWSFKECCMRPPSGDYRAAGLNLSEIGCTDADSMAETDRVVGKSSRGGSGGLEIAGDDNEEIDYEETYVNQDEIWRKEEDFPLQGIENDEDEDVENEEGNPEELCYQFQQPEIAAEKETYGADFKENGVIEEEDSDANEKRSQLTESETVKERENDVMEKEEVGYDNGDVEKEINEIETPDVSKGLAIDQIFAASIGFLVLILTFFSLFYCSKNTRTSSSTEKVATHENITEEKEEEIKKLAPFASPSSLVHEEPVVTSASSIAHPMEKEPKEPSHIRAPKVELLGEFDFGGEVASSFKSHGRKENIAESNYVPSRKNKVSMIQLDPRGDDSPSQGKLASGKKLVNKQRGNKNTEMSVVMPSPVRRSTRLQNRSVTSP